MSMRNTIYQITMINDLGCEIDDIQVEVEPGEDEAPALDRAMRSLLARSILTVGDSFKISEVY